MMVSDEEKRWIVVGIAMNKVVAPVLRDTVKQGMDNNFTDLDRHCQHLTPPCTLRTLIYGVVRTDPFFSSLKFQNINSNELVHGIRNYNFNINNSVDLAKLYLPGYLAQFSAFDESLDMTAILRLLGFKNYMPIPMFSPHTQASADDVRENIRNKWGHVDVTEWTNALFNDCFVKLETLVRSLGLTPVVERKVLNELADWQTKGCQLIMGHAVDKDLLHLVQDEVRDLIKDYQTMESQVNLQNKQIDKVEEDVSILKDQFSSQEAGFLSTMEKKLQDFEKNRSEEIGQVLERLLSFEVQLSMRLGLVEVGLAKTVDNLEQLKQSRTKTDDRVEQLEQNQTKTDDRVEQLEQRQTKTIERVEQVEQNQTRTDDRVEQLEQSQIKTNERAEHIEQIQTKTDDRIEQIEQSRCKTIHRVEQLEQSQTKTDDRVEQVEQIQTKTTDRVEQLEQSQARAGDRLEELEQRCDQVEQIEAEVKCLKTNNSQLEASPVKPFHLNTCRRKLQDHYQRTASVPTSVWSKKSVVDIRKIYTRLSLVKEKQTPAETTRFELKHYSHLFSADTDLDIIPKRILIQGKTGIGKSTFVKKLLVDWVDVQKETSNKETAVLKNFELVVAVNLKEVSKCQSFRDVIRLSGVFAKEDKYMTEGLVDYITNNQEKVLLIFDGYDEYRCGRNSEIYDIFIGNSLRECCVLITTRISKADELSGSEDLSVEITGFQEPDMRDFMARFLPTMEVFKLKYFLHERKLLELAKVPLLLLFFCTLWKEGQLKHFAETKTKLYMGIIQFILNHSHRKQSPPQYVEVQSFKAVLSEIGKIALQCLLKDDHLFEYNQLSDTASCEESVFIGLLQMTEYSESLRPVGMVSFIHKSIQEFLAAWYITFRCIPESGNLESEIGVKLEECLALENVFQFICGLSEEGAHTALSHFKSVRLSDPSLDLSKAIPDEENKTGVPLSDVTERQRKFNDLVLDSFEEIESKPKLSKTCLDCLGGILVVSRPVPVDLLPNERDVKPCSIVIEKSFWYFVTPESGFTGIGKPRRILSRVRPPWLTGITLGEFATEFQNANCIVPVDDFDVQVDVPCQYGSVLCFRNDQVHFYITYLELRCDNHSWLFKDISVSSDSTYLSSAHSCLKFLKSLYCKELYYNLTLGLTAVIKHCNHLERVEVSRSDTHSLCHLLVQVPNPSGCSLSIESCQSSSARVVNLASLLLRFGNVNRLGLHLDSCSNDATERLGDALINLKSLINLKLSGISLTSAVAAALGQSLPELSALQLLEIEGSFIGHRLQWKTEMETLFHSFNRPSGLRVLKIVHFNARGTLHHLTKKLCFFPFLEELYLERLDMGETDLFSLFENMKFIPKLRRLSLKGNPLGHAVRQIVPHLLKLQSLRRVFFEPGNDCSEEDLDYVREAVKGKVPQLKISYHKSSIFLAFL